MPISAKFTAVFTAISALIIASLIGMGITFKPDAATEKTDYMLKSYKNSVALYNGEELLEVYEDIVLNTLPQIDIHKFNQGIRIENINDIDEILQDYDG